MYGILIESNVEYLKETYGDAIWDEIRRRGDFTVATFSTHDQYSEKLMPAIGKLAAEITGERVEDIMDAFGVYFVSFVSQYGYDRILKVLGRHMRDFLNGLDNLHEYLRFSYPKLNPPSFFCMNESKSGLTLHYRSKRVGYLHYVKGQIRQVGKEFYNTKIDIYVISEEVINGTVHVVFRLMFDNKAYKESMKVADDSILDNIPVRSEFLFDLFPFHIVFDRQLVMRSMGNGLEAVLRNTIGKKLTAVFGLRRPLVNFSWDSIQSHTNNVFEIRSLYTVKRHNASSEISDAGSSTTESRGIVGDVGSETSQEGNMLHLKGQMLFMCEWESMMFLGTPVMSSLDDMFNTGLYINDLSMHDSSRDLVLAGTQQSAELKLALDQEQDKSRLLEESMHKLDAEMQRTDALLYQMIPKPVADRLRKGEPSVNTCEVFDMVTILFSDVVGFTTICSKITPMEVVSMLNAMYTKFDHLSEVHSVYKVETIGDAYMVVSGAPTATIYHALQICDMALGMVDSTWDLTDPSTGGTMEIRVGIHSGTTVAGVVGIKMPRYCLFGDAVNTASRMETNGEAMKIHISETTKKELEPYPYLVEKRGPIPVKGKGDIMSYWLLGKEDNESGLKCPFASYGDPLNTHDKAAEPAAVRMYSPVSFDDVMGTHNSPKVNNALNNNDKIKTIVSVEAPKDSPKEIPKVKVDSAETFSKAKDVGMIKNTLHPSQKSRSEVMKTKSEKEKKSRTCLLV